MSNKIVHVEIPSTDLEKSKTFYEGIFGWKVSLIPEVNYAIFEVKDGIGGGFNRVESIALNTGYMNYIHVEDIIVTLKKIEEAGGKTLLPKTSIGQEMGYIAIFTDPCGAQMGLWAKS